MCLVAFAIDAHPAYPLIVAANRDEFYARPTRRAAVWPEAAGVVAGRDVQAGGTWMGVSEAGRWAAVTNYRKIGDHRPEASSRGDLVAGYLRGDAGPEAFAHRTYARGDDYNGFNLLLGEGPNLWYLSNRGAAPRPVGAGVHGLSNHLLDTPWTKVGRSTERLKALLDGAGPSPDDLFALLADRTPAPEEELPDTGLPPERERAVSSIFITSPDYGTRSSTVLLLDVRGGLMFAERTFGADGAPRSTRRFRFAVAPSRARRGGDAGHAAVRPPAHTQHEDSILHQ